MKTGCLLGASFALVTMCLPVQGGVTDTLQLLGISKADLISRFGNPEKILGPEQGYQTYEYRDGLGVVIHNGKVVQYVAKRSSAYKTDKGIRLGSDIAEVTAAYGDYTGTEDVEQWFGGKKQRILYRHPEYDRYKLNYADHDVIFFFDKNKKVETIWVGYIFPKE